MMGMPVHECALLLRAEAEVRVQLLAARQNEPGALPIECDDRYGVTTGRAEATG